MSYVPLGGTTFKTRLSYVYCERRYIPGARTAYTFHDEEIDMGSTEADLKLYGEIAKGIGGLAGLFTGVAAIIGLGTALAPLS